MIPTIEMISATEMTLNHHRNDPRNIGNGIKRTTKTGQQFSAYFLFIYIASFLRCAIYLLPHFILYFIFNKIVLKQNKSNCAIRLCLPDDVMTTVMTSVTGSHYKCSSNYQPRYVLTFYSPAPCSNTVKFLTQN